MHERLDERSGLERWLHLPVDIASLVVFRVAFGLVGAWQAYGYFISARYWRGHVWPEFRFTYYGFEWVQPLPGGWLEAAAVGLGVCGLLVAAGCWYRGSAVCFSLLLGYFFLFDATYYLNHVYLMILVGFLLAAVPAHHAWSVDAWTGRVERSETAPAWALGLLRFQFAVMYVYAAIAKMNPDWLAGEPMRIWLGRRTDFPVIGRFFEQEWMVYGMSYGALLFDLLVVPALLWRPTRVPALLTAVLFHWLNRQLFDIGVFPFLAMAATLLFLDPSWPRKVAAHLRRAHQPAPVAQPALAGPRLSGIALALAGVYVVAQLLIPLRHYAIPGDPNWTEQGHSYAWHMLLRSKSGVASFTVHDPATGTTWEVDPRDHLTPHQNRKMAIRPEMMRQLAHHLADLWAEDGHDGVEVRVDAWATLNGRPPARLVDPEVNLASMPRQLGPRAYILPLPAEITRISSP